MATTTSSSISLAIDVRLDRRERFEAIEDLVQ